MKFEQYNITPEIKKNLAGLGFKRPTDIQFKAIPSILKGEDVLAIAQTGTGKTAAFAIPIIDRIHRGKSSKRTTGIQCIVMVPTRELAMQIGEVFSSLSKHTKTNPFALYGGVEQDPQIKKLQDGLDVLIAWIWALLTISPTSNANSRKNIRPSSSPRPSIKKSKNWPFLR